MRCTRGAIFDVVVDLRPVVGDLSAAGSASSCAADEPARRSTFPPGCAHGFQTLEDDSEVFYQMTEFYAPEAARGVRWNDPAFGIEWPIADRRRMSERDATYPDFRP